MFSSIAASIVNIIISLITSLGYLIGIGAPPPYDAIVIGSGAGGCPLAETLAEAGLQVLLVERGTGTPPPETANLRDSWDALRSECSQVVRGNGGIALPVGNCLGGATSFNLGMWLEEKPSWIVENFGQGFGTEQEVTEAYEWVRERLATPTSEAAGSPTATYMEEVIKTFASPGGFNVGSVGPEGSPIHEENNIWRTYSIFDSETGERRSADKLLNFELENLVLSADTEVLEILFDGDDGVPRLPFLSQGDVPRARCIRTAARGFLRPQKITCVRDGGRIYVAAGTIHSAALLLQSGVGPGKRIESPEVGENFSDKPLLPLAGNFENSFNNSGVITFGHIAGSTEVVTSGGTTMNILMEENSYGVPGLLKLLGSWRNNIPVFARNFWSSDIVFLVTDFCQAQIESSNSPFLFLCNDFVTQVENGCDTTTGITVAVSTPTSKGRVFLNELGEVEVDGNFVSTDDDLEALGFAARSAFSQLVARPPPVALQLPCEDPDDKACLEQSCPDISAGLINLSKLTLSLLNPPTAEAIPSAPASMIQPNFFEQYIESTEDNLVLGELLSEWITSGYHYCGTNGIGAVVDENLKVIGAEGLYVADASVIPRTPRVNSMATALMVGRRAGVKFLEERAR